MELFAEEPELKISCNRKGICGNRHLVLHRIRDRRIFLLLYVINVVVVVVSVKTTKSSMRYHY